MENSMYCYAKNSLDKTPNTTLYYFKGKKITKEQFFKDVDILSIQLKNLGLKSGEVVAINLPNLLNAIVTFYAVNKLGGIANMIHPLMPIAPVKTILNNTKTKMFFTFDDFYSKNSGEVDNLGVKIVICRASDYLPFIKKQVYKTKEPKFNNPKLLYFSDLLKNVSDKAVTPFKFDMLQPAVYLHSGGTTGEPKTVILSNFAFNSLADSLKLVVEEDRQKDKPYHDFTSLMVLPLFHGFGLGVCMHAFLSMGIENVLIPKFNSKEFCKLAKKRNANVCAGVPLMFSKLFKENDKHFSMLKTFQYLFCGGDRLSYELKTSFDERLKNCGSTAEILEGYGLTETVTVCSVCKKNDYENFSVGYPLDGLSINIINNENKFIPPNTKGEICIKGDTLMNGYLNLKTDNIININGEKWLKTGDLGYVNEQGKLFFIDRIKRTFKIYGVNIYPGEIEQTVKNLGFLKECYATKSSKDSKECVHIIYSLKKDFSQAESEKLMIDACRCALIAYATPKVFTCLEDLPHTPVGKIDTKELELLNKNI